jgi:hypothetical protein
MYILLFHVVQNYCRVNITNIPSLPFVNHRGSSLFSSGPVYFIYVLKEIIWKTYLPHVHKISKAKRLIFLPQNFNRGVDKSLARHTSRCILFDGENISFDASLVIYINSNNIPPIMIINRIYENQNLLSLLLVSFLVGIRTYQHCRLHVLRIRCIRSLRDGQI